LSKIKNIKRGPGRVIIGNEEIGRRQDTGYGMQDTGYRMQDRIVHGSAVHS